MDLNKILNNIKDAFNFENVYTLTKQEMKEELKKYAVITKYNNLATYSNVRNRSAALTVIYSKNKQLMKTQQLTEKKKKILDNLDKTLTKVFNYIKKIPLLKLSKTMFENNYYNAHCHLLFSTLRKDNIRIPYMWTNSLNDYNKELPGQDFYLIYIPEWQENERQIIVIPDINTTFVLGTDYYGEIKKGFLRMAMYKAKTDYNLLGLHAGSKLIKIKDKYGKFRKYAIILFGLSGTGKTTHSVHTWGIDGKDEYVKIVQDDFVALKKDGSAYGTEIGFFIKTDGLDKKAEPLIYNAAISENAILENVMVNYKREIDFKDTTLTSNGRGIIQWTDLKEKKAESMNIPPLSQLDGLIFLFITRRYDILPMIQKLTPSQAAAAFLLGESIETSAGDPTKAGQSVRVVGTNPFIVGDKSEEANIFYKILKNLDKNKVESFLLNTGKIGINSDIGKDSYKITISDNSAVLKSILKKEIEWEKYLPFNTYIPKIDNEKLKVENYYSTEKKQELEQKLKRERIEYMKNFSNLNEEIKKAILGESS